MMKDNAKGIMMAAMAFAALTESINKSEGRKPFIPDTQEDKARLRQKQIEVMEKKGVKEFRIDGVTVYARNKKNAMRKFNNMKRI